MVSGMERIDAQLGRIASGQNRIVTTDQLHDRGLTDAQVAWLRASKRLTKLYRGVHLIGAGPLAWEEQAAAVCFAHPSGVLSHSSAGRVHGIRKSAQDRLEITIPTGTSCSLPRVKVHRSNRLDPEDIFHLLDGIRVTSPERLLFDQAGVLDAFELRSALDHALEKKLTNVDALQELALRMVTRGRRGSADFSRAVARLDSNYKPVESDGELVIANGLEYATVPTPERQNWVRLPTGAHVRIDLAFPEVRLAIEYDHSFWHAIPSRVQADKARDVWLKRVHWTVLRFTELELLDLGAVIRSIEAVYRDLVAGAA